MPFHCTQTTSVHKCRDLLQQRTARPQQIEELPHLRYETCGCNPRGMREYLSTVSIMTVAGRLRVAGGSMIVGILVTWGVYHAGRNHTPAGVATASPPIASTPVPGASVLWLLSIGVSRYQQVDFNLQLADVDARAIAAALQEQEGTALYRAVRALVLTNEEVTRESILDGMGRFLRQAGSNDVVVIFVAGHGVLDRSSGSYYFLPFPVTAQNIISAGMRMSDFDEMVRGVRRRVRAVVMMLDTCHAGALRVIPSDVAAMDEPAARLSVGDGFFLLAATKPGEQSQEQPVLGHGAFTFALLEGLRGAADTDRDGLLSVADLFSYVTREVPRLTGGAQHPYNKTEGTDLLFATVQHDIQLPTPAAPAEAVAQPNARAAATPVPNTIGVMQFHNVRADPEHDWVGTALRTAFNTELSKVRALHVYAPELIDRTAKVRGADQLTTAQELGIDRLVTGSYNIVGTTVLIDARIVDATTGLQEGSDSVRGELSDIFDLQKKLVLSLLRRLRVRLSPEEGKSIENGTNADVDAYRLLLDTEEFFEESLPPGNSPRVPHPTPTMQEPRSRREDGTLPRRSVLAASGALVLMVEQAVLQTALVLHAMPVHALVQYAPKPADLLAFWQRGVAYAAEVDAGIEGAIRRLLEEYRQALQQKDLDHLSHLYLAFPARRRDALRAYFENALDFEVEISDVNVTPHGNDVAVSYTRLDRFRDRGTGKVIRLEVRLTRIVVPEGGKWKIAGRE